jgi:dihydrofolate reductase
MSGPRSSVSGAEYLGDTDACRLTAVVAMTPERVIGLNGHMPWQLKSDLKRFKSLTMGGWLIMGRKTFDSIGKPLPGRQTVVLTRNRDWSFPGVAVANDVSETLRMVESAPAFVVGGAEIYRLFWPYCSQIYLTWVMAKLNGDTWLDVDLADFAVCERMRVSAGPDDSFPTEFCCLKRKKHAD